MRASFVFRRGDSESTRSVVLRHAVIAGWTGRDRRKVEEHIEELHALGVSPPSTTPLFYRVSASRLTSADRIEVCGEETSGEVEAVLVALEGSLWVGAGSDHTDRALERTSVAMSKQICDKPLAPELWAFDDVADHWDALELRSWRIEGAERALYQEGAVNALLAPRDLIDAYAGGTLADATAMFCGTLPAIGGVRPAGRFAFQLTDPVRKRAIRHEYAVRVLPIVQ
jgi:hypothetical protein